MSMSNLTRREWLTATAKAGTAAVISSRLSLSALGANQEQTSFDGLSRIEFLPELEKLDLSAKARVIQALIEENFFHPSGLFYSLLLIDGPHHIRPLAKADLTDALIRHCDYLNDKGTMEAARSGEGLTFENSIYSAGLYLQSQAARYAVTSEPAAYEQALRALRSLYLVYDYSRQRGKAGWLGKPYGRIPKDHSTPDQYHAAMLGLYRFWEVAKAPERDQIAAMLRDFADFMTQRNYHVWNLNYPPVPDPGNLAESNATYVLAQAIALRITGEDRYRAEALRLAKLGFWRKHSLLEAWAEQGFERFLRQEYVCQAGMVVHNADTLYDILPELFGATPAEAKEAMSRMLAPWWTFCQLGMDNKGYQHYWIDIDVRNKTWRPTGIRPIEKPHFPDTFGTYYSDVRWSDSFYRTLLAAIPVIKHLPAQRDAALAWVRETMQRISGQRMRWFVDLDGRQLKPDIKWMGCMLSSEAPFHYLITYWRGRRLGWFSGPT